MLTATVIWMTVPERIVYRESSPVQTPAFSVEVKQHGTSFFVTPSLRFWWEPATLAAPRFESNGVNNDLNPTSSGRQR